MSPTQETRAHLIPREYFFGNPEKTAPKVSPDGKRLAFLAPDEGVLNLWVSGDLHDPAKARPVTRDRGRGIRAYFWTEDGGLVYLQDKDGDENWHLYQADPAGGPVRDLTPFPGAQAQVVATDPRFPNDLLIAANVRDKSVHDVYRVNLKTGKAKLELENPGDMIGWLPDQNMRLRAAKAQLPDGSSELRVRDDDESPWRTLVRWGPDESGGAFAFAPDNRTIYLESSLGSDTTRLLAVDSKTGTDEKIFRHPEADIAGVVLHPRDYRLQAVAYDPARLEWKVVDPAIEADFAALRNLAEGDFQIVSRDDADRWWTVLYNSDRKPARYYLYDRQEKKAELLFSTRPKLENVKLSATRAVRFKARDGLLLRGYLTLPSAERSQRPHPMVLLVHGGPWERDRWGFHPEALWLADRGFAVLRVNYRGSNGFGKKFLHAGDREWGAKMQDDLTDSVRWAAAEGFADPRRVAIYGGSYGGYAALAGAAFTPDVYACAVDIVGPSNLSTLIRSIPPYWKLFRTIFDLRVGKLDTEPEFLDSRSPLFSADKITIPLLIAQGANDPRVKQAESEQIVKALKANGKEVEYLLFPDEGHGFARPENRLKFYEKAESFLSRHLGS